MNKVMQNMETIERIFREVQDAYSDATPLTALYPSLDAYAPEFRSIAYEAASMCIALSDLQHHQQLKDWFEFLQHAPAHATQIHVGLGWALAQKELNPLDFFNVLAPLLRYRVADGYGYYEGIFRKRKSVLSQQQPTWHDATALDAYDQGLGRSLWYLHHGNIEEVQKLVDRFPLPRRAALWRGLGIAITYAGGCEESALLKISATAPAYKKQLAAGSLMALLSRQASDTVTRDALLACRVLSGKGFDELLSLHQPAEDVSYAEWVRRMEESM